MHLPLFMRQRVARAAIVFLLLALAVFASAAMASANSPRVLPVEPDGGIGTEQPIPVEPDGGIGN